MYRSKIELHNIDCLPFMKQCKDKQFDLAIVDPPYGIERFKKESKSNNRVEKFFNTGEWNNNVPTKEYFNELFRISKNQVIWGYNHLSDLLPKTSGFIFWNKHQNGNFSEGELAWCSLGNGKYFDRAYQKDIGGKIHPTQKPIELYEWILEHYATCKTCNNEGGYYEDVAGDGGSQMWQHCDDCDNVKPKILDTHLGSGSIAIACDEYGFDLTACEIDKDYFNKASKRLEPYRKQRTLF